MSLKQGKKNLSFDRCICRACEKRRLDDGVHFAKFLGEHTEEPVLVVMGDTSTNLRWLYAHLPEMLLLRQHAADQQEEEGEKVEDQVARNEEKDDSLYYWLVSHELAGKGPLYCSLAGTFIRIPANPALLPPTPSEDEGEDDAVTEELPDESQKQLPLDLEISNSDDVLCDDDLAALPSSHVTWIVPRLITSGSSFSVTKLWEDAKEPVQMILFVNTDLVKGSELFDLGIAVEDDNPRNTTTRGMTRSGFKSIPRTLHLRVSDALQRRVRHRRYLKQGSLHISATEGSDDGSTSPCMWPALVLSGYVYCENNAFRMIHFGLASNDATSLWKKIPIHHDSIAAEASRMLYLAGFSSRGYCPLWSFIRVFASHSEAQEANNVFLAESTSAEERVNRYLITHCAAGGGGGGASRHGESRGESPSSGSITSTATIGTAATVPCTHSYYPIASSADFFFRESCCLSDIFVFEFAQELFDNEAFIQLELAQPQQHIPLVASVTEYISRRKYNALVQWAMEALRSWVTGRCVFAWDATDPVEQLPRVGVCISYEVSEKVSLPLHEETMEGTLRHIIPRLRSHGWVLVYQEDHSRWGSTPDSDSGSGSPRTPMELWQAALVNPKEALRLYVGCHVVLNGGHRGVVKEFRAVPNQLVDYNMADVSIEWLLKRQEYASFIEWHKKREKQPRWRPGLPPYMEHMETNVWPVVKFFGSNELSIVLPTVEKRHVVRYPSRCLVTAEQQRQHNASVAHADCDGAASSYNNNTNNDSDVTWMLPRGKNDCVRTLRLPLSHDRVESIESIYLASAQTRSFMWEALRTVHWKNINTRCSLQRNWSTLHHSRWQDITMDFSTGAAASSIPMGARRCLQVSSFLHNKRALRCVALSLPHLRRLYLNYDAHSLFPSRK